MSDQPQCSAINQWCLAEHVTPLLPVQVEVQTEGVIATLIDFTASRLNTIAGDVAFCDLAADPEIFEGPKGECQFDTYRK